MPQLKSILHRFNLNHHLNMLLYHVRLLEEGMHSFSLTPEHLSTPEVQCVVVWHIVKSTDIASQVHSPPKLRSFSGKVPCPNYEVDYETWRTSVDFYLTDSTVSHSQLVRRIVNSLTSSCKCCETIWSSGQPPLLPGLAWLSTCNSGRWGGVVCKIPQHSSEFRRETIRLPASAAINFDSNREKESCKCKWCKQPNTQTVL